MTHTDKSLPGSTVYLFRSDFAASELAKIDLVIIAHRESVNVAGCGKELAVVPSWPSNVLIAL